MTGRQEEGRHVLLDPAVRVLHALRQLGKQPQSATRAACCADAVFQRKPEASNLNPKPETVGLEPLKPQPRAGFKATSSAQRSLPTVRRRPLSACGVLNVLHLPGPIKQQF